jgi:hypothetical protein
MGTIGVFSSIPIIGTKRSIGQSGFPGFPVPANDLRFLAPEIAEITVLSAYNLNNVQSKQGNFNGGLIVQWMHVAKIVTSGIPF